jgi:hypothetical protein
MNCWLRTLILGINIARDNNVVGISWRYSMYSKLADVRVLSHGLIDKCLGKRSIDMDIRRGAPEAVSALVVAAVRPKEFTHKNM